MSPWFRFLIAFVVFGHGFVYVRIGAMLPSPVPGWRGSSWLLGDTLAGNRLNATVVSLHVLAGLTLITCAMAIAFAPAMPRWWSPLAIAGSLIGLLAFAVFWDGQAKLLFEEGALGAALSAILLVAALASGPAFR